MAVEAADLARLLHLLDQLPQNSKIGLQQHPHILLRTLKLVLRQLQPKARAKAQAFSAKWPVLLRKSVRVRSIRSLLTIVQEAWQLVRLLDMLSVASLAVAPVHQLNNRTTLLQNKAKAVSKAAGVLE